MAFASGKRTWGICDISGFRYRLRDMKMTWDGFLVGPDQWEPKHPQLNPPQFAADAEAIRNPRPARVEPASDSLLVNNPFLSTASSSVVTVFEDDHGRTTGDKVRFRGTEPFAGLSSSVLEDPDGYSITVISTDTYSFGVSSGTADSAVRGGGGFVSVGSAQAALPLDPFKTLTSGENAQIQVTEFKHNRTNGDTVRFRNTAAFDGITTTVLEASGGYTITVVDDNNYKFTSTGTATTGDVSGGGFKATAGPTT